MNVKFFILALRVCENPEKFKKTVALFRNASYKDMQGEKLAKAVTFFVLLRIKK